MVALNISVYQQLCAVVQKHLKLGAGPAHVDGTWLGGLIEEAGAILGQILNENLASEQWIYFRIAVSPGQSKLEMIRTLSLVLEKFVSAGSIYDWWWLNKTDALGDAIRVRVSVTRALRNTAQAAVKTQLECFGYEYTILCYEPELCLFGGLFGIKAAHDYFCAESRFLAKWIGTNRTGQNSILPEGLSLAILLRLLGACALDTVECWDVFSRVYARRRFFDDIESAAKSLQTLVHKVISAGPAAIFRLYADENKNAVLLTDYDAFLARFGRDLCRGYLSGLLECGLREFLASIIFFHWNRIGLSAFQQFELARVATEELRRLSQEG